VAVRFANATGALATMGVGAQQALPTRAAVADFLAAHLPDWQQV
jgi:sugar/nucleoside kinase (ribokinase family)